MIVNKYNQGGGGSGSGVTPEQVQQQIDSALTPYWDSAVTESAITEAVSGKADAKIVIDFDHTSQAERAALYADLYDLYDGGSGATINRNYDFYKTVNTWQGLKIDYYGFSGDTLVFGKVVSPENITDEVVYEQVMTIDSEGNVEVATNSVGGGADMSAYWTSAQTESAITAVENHLYDVEEVTASALTELHNSVLELSDLASSGYVYFNDDGMGNTETNLDNTYAFLKGNDGDGYSVDPPQLVDYDAYDSGSAGTPPFPKHLVTIYRSDYDDLVNNAGEDSETFYIVLPDPV